MRKDKLCNVYPVLHLLGRLDSDDRANIIPFLSQEACEGIYECIHNGLHNKKIHSNSRKELRKGLKKNADILRCILNPKSCEKTKKKKLIQVGGDGIGLIVKTVLPYIVEHLLEENEFPENGNDS